MYDNYTSFKHDGCFILHYQHTIIPNFSSFVSNKHIFEVKPVNLVQCTFIPFCQRHKWTQRKLKNTHHVHAFLLFVDWKIKKSSVESQKGIIAFMFCWIGRYCHRCCTAMVPFWFSTEHLWAAITPFCFSIDEMSSKNIHVCMCEPLDYTPFHTELWTWHESIPDHWHCLNELKGTW